MALLIAAGEAPAQNLNLVGPWAFAAGPQRSRGDVDRCRNNAPGGFFWAAGQPVLKAEAAVNERWFLWSSCLASVTANVTFTVGPAPTLVEFECTLNADRVLQDVPGLVSVSGSGFLDGRIVLGCIPKPAALVVKAKDAPAVTFKVKRCLQPGVPHTAQGDLTVLAQISGGVGDDKAISNAFTTIRNPVGLPQGLMLILQPKGVCVLKKAIGDFDGDGEFALADLLGLEQAILGQIKAPDMAVMLADVAGECDGTLDYDDFTVLKNAWAALIEGGDPVMSSCHPAAIGDVLPEQEQEREKGP
ncbi:MAG: hypothetical protein IH977_02385 [Nitrospinae bacterium]|nr:hypothetical protein [Nitrospinota bacterium]